MLIVYVDADACPVKDEVYRVARRYAMKVAVVANAPLRVPPDPLIELVVRPGFGAADDWIAEQVGPGDIVITADIPLAARCLAREARVLDAEGPSVHGQRHRLGAGHARPDGRAAAGRGGDRRPGPDDGEGPLALPVEARRGRQRRSPRHPAADAAVISASP